jgi:hypothetical protein
MECCARVQSHTARQLSAQAVRSVSVRQRSPQRRACPGGLDGTCGSAVGQSSSFGHLAAARGCTGNGASACVTVQPGSAGCSHPHARFAALDRGVVPADAGRVAPALHLRRGNAQDGSHSASCAEPEARKRCRSGARRRGSGVAVRSRQPTESEQQRGAGGRTSGKMPPFSRAALGASCHTPAVQTPLPQSPALLAFCPGGAVGRNWSLRGTARRASVRAAEGVRSHARRAPSAHGWHAARTSRRRYVRVERGQPLRELPESGSVER